MSSRFRRSSSLFVSRLSSRTTTEDLEETFREFGRLKDVYIPRNYYTREPRGFAYIEYYDERDCEEAYRHRNFYLHGRELTVEFARGDRKTPREMRHGGGGVYPRERYTTPENSYRPRYSRSRSPSKRFYDEHKNNNRQYKSRSISRSPQYDNYKRSEKELVGYSWDAK
ncbi:14107_t:CDS:2 [Entrophospora sp. SA101]|nr:6844_t:CDS:2 [Entrophospora candida]CAJ0637313.1 11157_t:CDS:2 [Entrophospora sp. SA101]CAG8618927.1 8723_t:CDS:2 [Entrophospora candida]CAJ0747476.1 6676_t:CDS:2 [Entrophospora sp. SA101]CAJ0757936.1 14107_t:CDS:2 [Entrophospora sp. SA101]